jgi:hypothetical protein
MWMMISFILVTILFLASIDELRRRRHGPVDLRDTSDQSDSSRVETWK